MMLKFWLGFAVGIAAWVLGSIVIEDEDPTIGVSEDGTVWKQVNWTS